MGTLEEIKKMQDRGIDESKIKESLRTKGITTREIDDSFAQSQIKTAVVQPGGSTIQGQPQDNSQMQASLLPPESQNPTPDFNGPGQVSQSQTQPQAQQPQNYKPQLPQQSGYEETAPVQNYAPPESGQLQELGNQEYDEYQPYQSYSSGPSSEMISEVTEQLITEKLSDIRKKIEKSLDSKNTIGTKVDYLDERLKRMEKIIDTLQSSVLRRVGDYVSDVQDIKTELVETQKSLSKLFPQIQDGAHKKHAHHKTNTTHKKTTHHKKK